MMYNITMEREDLVVLRATITVEAEFEEAALSKARHHLTEHDELFEEVGNSDGDIILVSIEKLRKTT